jgi:hypothetical protein
MATVYFPTSELAPKQTYTITLHLQLPTSPPNIDHGAFNVELYMFSHPGPISMRAPYFFSTNTSEAQSRLLLLSRRPGALTWRSPLLSTLETLFQAPLLLTGLSRQEETVRIPLCEAATFSTSPRSAAVEVDPGLTIYQGTLEFSAKLAGLRWVMYHWWLPSFVVGTLGFWAVEMAAMVAVWWWVVGWLRVETEETEEREESQELPEVEQELKFDDVQRTFPTQRLGYPTPEPGEGEVGDDEESEVEVLRDSGLGTETTGRERRGSAIRRRSRGAGTQ